MTAPIPVHTTLPAYLTAIDQLPLTVAGAADPAGAIVVVDGAPGWPARARTAAAAGARAIVVHDPVTAPDHEDAGVPVVVARPRLPEAYLLPSPGPVRLIRVEVTSRDQRWLRDGLGWARVLAGSPLAPAQAAAGSALFVSGDVPVVTAVVASGGLPSIRVTALGETETEVRVDDIDIVRETTGAEGTLRAAAVLEEPARRALRRALRVLRSGERIDDLALLRADDHLAALMTPRHQR